ncbi:MAG TPA: DUF4352 domain-containing protein [Polyangiaceae bacterium]|nr:DUF4352 domain-containing protein [Polyangiaceae bacterium]
MFARSICPIELLPTGFVVLSLVALGCRASHSADPAPASAPAPKGPMAAAATSTTASAVPTAAPGPTPAVIGKGDRYLPADATASLPHFSMSLGQVRPCTVEPYLVPKAGNIVLGIEVSVEGKGPVGVPVNSLYATLEGKNGELYEATLAGCTPALPSTHIRKGDQVKGIISFVVPEGNGGWKLRYHPAIIGFPDEEARFDLGK